MERSCFAHMGELEVVPIGSSSPLIQGHGSQTNFDLQMKCIFVIQSNDSISFKPEDMMRTA